MCFGRIYCTKTDTPFCEFADSRYVQVIVTCDGTILCEVISNLNIRGVNPLSEANESSLRQSGWGEPTIDDNPNWHVVCRNGSGLLRISRMMHDAVYDVLGERPHNPVEVRSWSVSERTLCGVETTELSCDRSKQAVRQLRRHGDIH
jgi:hypothetical protein